MYVNPDRIVEILPIYPLGTNSTMFTECCEVAICDDEPNCPSCGRAVIGHELPEGLRRSVRWNNATRNWKIKNR